jgi:hypothetical protein
MVTDSTLMIGPPPGAVLRRDRPEGAAAQVEQRRKVVVRGEPADREAAQPSFSMTSSDTE